ncbi:centromere protein U isoform X2 [Phyllobates terribilis]|uniref:centromere protein U isoform X2 n=1 Tax=Phyllobates terribilis TaxID=111132 RepID=UPI003CCACBFD
METDVRTKREMSPNKKSKNINQSTKSLKSQNIKSPGRIKEADAERSADKMRKIMNKKVGTPILKQILAHANISAILKETGDAFQELADEDSFNPPLHSTAVYNDGDDDFLQTNENRDQTPAKLISPIASVVQEESIRRMESKQNPAASMELSAQRPDTAKPKESLQKETQKIPEPGPSKMHGSARTGSTGETSSTQGPKRKVTPQKKAQKGPEPSKMQGPDSSLAIGEPSSAQGPNTAPNRNVRLQKKTQNTPEPGPSKTRRTARTRAVGETSSTQGPSTTQKTNVVSAKNAKAQRKGVITSSKKKPRKDNLNIAPGDTSSPEVVSKSAKSLNELDIVLLECGKCIESHREEVETDDCKREVDVFYHSFKEQLSTTISQLQKLKDLKRKNAKMRSEIGMKRKRLLQLKHEVIVDQPKLNLLQKECADLEQKHKARAILDNLAHFQDDYMKFKAENPHVQETYGTSSLPALCLEAGNIMKAEQHFHIVNRKLQSVIDKEKGD